jgi:hypothetical protein
VAYQVDAIDCDSMQMCMCETVRVALAQYIHKYIARQNYTMRTQIGSQSLKDTHTHTHTHTQLHTHREQLHSADAAQGASKK